MGFVTIYLKYKDYNLSVTSLTGAGLAFVSVPTLIYFNKISYTDYPFIDIYSSHYFSPKIFFFRKNKSIQPMSRIFPVFSPHICIVYDLTCKSLKTLDLMFILWGIWATYHPSVLGESVFPCIDDCPFSIMYLGSNQ